MFDALILGGGAAGLVCAIQAAKRGLSVCLLERNGEFGKKIRATGNGRCNLSNLDMGPAHFHGGEESFVQPALEAFGETELSDFFTELGMPLTALEDGRLFPHSLQAGTVVRALTKGAADAGAILMPEAYVKHAEKREEGFAATLFDNRVIEGRKLILATGGASMRKSGSDGNGYALARSFTHTVHETFPGIVALTLQGRVHKELDGVKIPSKLTLAIDGKKIREDRGDILFTSYGLSGPPVLQQSRHVLWARKQGKKPVLYVSLLREDWMHTDRLFAFLKGSTNTAGDALRLLLHERIPGPLLRDIGIREDVLLQSVQHRDIQKIMDALRGWPFIPDGARPLEQAQVTCGGVDTKEIHAHTLESKKVEGLYMIGELTDVDGDCGGYNLHWAFASGFLCAKAL